MSTLSLTAALDVGGWPTPRSDRFQTHSNEITHTIRKIKGYGFVIFLEVKFCFYFLQWKKDPILN